MENVRIRMLQDNNNQHIAVIENSGELRCAYSWYASEVTARVTDNLRNDLARLGDAAFLESEKWETLPLVSVRKSKRSGKNVYEVQEDDTTPLLASQHEAAA
jgi:hypothetical protein